VSEKTKQQLGKLSRNKGSNNENRLAKKLDAWFYGDELTNWDTKFPHLSERPKNKRRIIRRTPMSGGWSKCGDLKVDPEFKGVPMFPFFVEAKKEEVLDPLQIMKGVGKLYGYLTQAAEENGGKTPITAVIFTKNNCPDFMMTSEEDFDIHIKPHADVKRYIVDEEREVVVVLLDEFIGCADLNYYRGLSDSV